jgi:hypothetical protein
VEAIKEDKERVAQECSKQNEVGADQPFQGAPLTEGVQERVDTASEMFAPYIEVRGTRDNFGNGFSLGFFFARTGEDARASIGAVYCRAENPAPKA